jgi:hypothetical protein
LFVALERAWPVRGRPKSRLTRGAFVAALVTAGVPKSRIAEHERLSPGEVSDLERDGRRAAREAFQCDPPRIDADPRGEVPFEPSTQLGAVMSSKPDGGENLRRAGELLDELAAEGEKPPQAS